MRSRQVLRTPREHPGRQEPGVTDAAAGSTDTTGTSGTADTADSARRHPWQQIPQEARHRASSGGETAADGSADVTGEYVLNTNTKKFHQSSCSSVAQMSPENKAAFSGSREELMQPDMIRARDVIPDGILSVQQMIREMQRF